MRNSWSFNVVLQVFLVRKVTPPDANQLYAMKVLKKATLKGTPAQQQQIITTGTKLDGKISDLTGVNNNVKFFFSCCLLTLTAKTFFLVMARRQQGVPVSCVCVQDHPKTTVFFVLVQVL